MKTVDVNTTTLQWKDYLIVRGAKVGDIVKLSDGDDYTVKHTETSFYGGCGENVQSYIPYGVNDTSDNR